MDKCWYVRECYRQSGIKPTLEGVSLLIVMWRNRRTISEGLAAITKT